MPREEQSSTHSHQSLPQGGGLELSLDELAKGLASGTLSRGKALRWMGGALLGAALASFPGVALANDDCRRLGRECRRDSQCCSGNCVRRGDDKVCGCPEGKRRCGDRCVNLQRNERHCGRCGNRCAEGEQCVGGMCTPTCAQNGATCTEGTQCCSGICDSSGFCFPPTGQNRVSCGCLDASGGNSLEIPLGCFSECPQFESFFLPVCTPVCANNGLEFASGNCTPDCP
jgi:hypothetical protein